VKSFFRTVDNFGERHFLKFENQTSGGGVRRKSETRDMISYA
jgi:hypothetical protein